MWIISNPYVIWIRFYNYLILHVHSVNDLFLITLSKAMVADLRHVVFSFCCLKNAKKQKHEESTKCRLFVFSLFRIFEATKQKYNRRRAKIRHIKSVVYSHSICPIFTFSHCYIFALLHFRFFALLHFRVPVAHAHGDINLKIPKRYSLWHFLYH
jgi:hypothetical protein